ncbi:ThiF family adenylyltransferase [Terriglobus roseus]|uniref:ThiF family adenylyltransferase n=1 Tax=Terriglobus roseus TaxID=392734 RepID=UPI001FCD0A35|nr:ThiF family adenylyltransferase [Terriglobus roseus]
MSVDVIELADRADAPKIGSGDDRYSRQRLFPFIGEEGQRRLANSHVALVGCGATGAASAGLLARAGVGHLTIIDRDFVEPSNLQRQMLFTEDDAREALPKAEAARRRLLTINSEVTVTAHIADLTPANALTLLGGAGVILDATDNFETRYLLNDYAVKTGTPWIYAAAIGSYAATMNILPVGEHRTACLACIFPEPPAGTVETCDTAGILNTAVNVAASLQSTEAIKLLTGQPAAMRRTLLSMDLWTGEHSEVSAARPRPACTVCGLREFPHLAGEGRPHITMCGRNSVQIHEHNRPVDFATLADRLRPLGEVRWNSLMLRFLYGVYTLSVFADGRTVVQGTSEVPRARALYARFIGS